MLNMNGLRIHSLNFFVNFCFIIKITIRLPYNQIKIFKNSEHGWLKNIPCYFIFVKIIISVLFKYDTYAAGG